METSALNLAHQQHRRAEAHLRYRRFDEAIKCHKEASRLLEEAMKLTNVAKALESLTLQRDYHIQQESVIKMKSNCYEKHLKSAACDHKKIINPEIPVQPERESHHLQAEIYKTMEEADSLLQILLKKGTLSKEVLGNKENNLPENTVTEQEAVARLEPSEWKPCMSGSRLPKDDQTVIEELRVVNEQLRSQIITISATLLSFQLGDQGENFAAGGEKQKWEECIGSIDESCIFTAIFERVMLVDLTFPWTSMLRIKIYSKDLRAPHVMLIEDTRGKYKSHVVQLLEDLDLCHKENDHLKRRILRLEGQFGKYPVVGRGSTNSHLPMCDMFNDCILQRKGSENNPVGPASCLRVTTESSPGSSPFVLSPCSELSPDGGRQLPALAPLEMPAFDFPGLLPKQTSEEIK